MRRPADRAWRALMPSSFLTFLLPRASPLSALTRRVSEALSSGRYGGVGYAGVALSLCYAMADAGTAAVVGDAASGNEAAVADVSTAPSATPADTSEPSTNPSTASVVSPPRSVSSSPPPPKTVFFVRHAESAYNAFKLSPMNWLTLRALQDPMIYDPPLSPLGLQQLLVLSQLSLKHRLTERAQLIVSSPLRRAIDTALAVMGQQYNPAVKRDHTPPAYPLPVLISPHITEVLDTSADIGSPPSVLRSLYPQLEFGHLDDAWWYHADKSDPRRIDDEPLALVLERMERFKTELMARREQCVVVVSHSSFIKRLTGARSKIGNCQVQECRMGWARDGKLHVQVVVDKLE